MRFENLPDLLTVEEAARFLRISRGLAYQLAREYLATKTHGLPVIRLGGRLRVPKRQLGKLLDGELALRAPAPERSNKPRRESRADTPAQLTLLEAN